jgi:hypothetical protein
MSGSDAFEAAKQRAQERKQAIHEQKQAKISEASSQLQDHIDLVVMEEIQQLVELKIESVFRPDEDPATTLPTTWAWITVGRDRYALTWDNERNQWSLKLGVIRTILATDQNLQDKIMDLHAEYN